LHLLQEAAQTVASILDLDEVLYRIQDVVYDALGPDLSAIFLLDETGERTYPRVMRDSAGARRVYDSKEVLYSSTVLNHALRKRVALLSNDVPQEFAEGESVVGLKLLAAMCVPFLFQGEVLGALYMHNNTSGHDLTQDSLQLASALCNLTAVAIQNAKLVERVREEARQRGNLERYFSPDVVDRIMHNTAMIDDGGHREDVTILFSDIRGFTRLSERTPPEELIPLLNEYFSAMVAVIFKYGGTIDKFIGDAILAYFGGFSEDDDIAENTRKAVRCAIEMQARLSELNAEWEAGGRPRLDMGIGVHQGEVTMGTIGSEKRREFTILGDPVNAACRLSDIAQGGQIVISDAVERDVEDKASVEAIPTQTLKGKTREVRLFLVR
jgi:adenylate cyclase